MFAELTLTQQERVAATVRAAYADIVRNSIENALFPVNEEQEFPTAVVAL